MIAVAGGQTASVSALLLAVFAASAVEMVEALTIVLAAGTARSWRSALEGTGAAIVLLAALTAAVGVPLARYVPIDSLRMAVGSLLLLMGISWLRKAVLRAGGVIPKHDEDAIFAKTVAALGRGGGSAGQNVSRPEKGRDLIAFTVAFKGVMLEGFEVILIVISLGSSDHRLGLAALAAGAAAVIVGAAGVVLSRQLSGVPENTLKTVVGVMLTSFGVFWTGEGAGVRWPGSDLSLPGLIALFAAATALMTLALKRQPARLAGELQRVR
jgi:uncharacterized membrane protein